MVLVFISKAYALKIIVTDDKSFVTSPYIYVIANIEREDATHVMITVNDIKSPLIHIASNDFKSQFKDYLIIDVELEKGENLPSLSLFKNGRPIEEKKALVNLILPPGDIPNNAKKNYFHKEEKENLS